VIPIRILIAFSPVVLGTTEAGVPVLGSNILQGPSVVWISGALSIVAPVMVPRLDANLWTIFTADIQTITDYNIPSDDK
jgi:hypothetical protein